MNVKPTVESAKSFSKRRLICPATPENLRARLKVVKDMNGMADKLGTLRGKRCPCCGAQSEAEIACHRCRFKAKLIWRCPTCKDLVQEEGECFRCLRAARIERFKKVAGPVLLQGGSYTEAAAALGVTYHTLYGMINQIPGLEMYRRPRGRRPNRDGGEGMDVVPFAKGA